MAMSMLLLVGGGLLLAFLLIALIAVFIGRGKDD